MAAFNFTPSFIYIEELKFKTIVSEAESGKEQRRKKWTNPKREFTLKFDAIDDTTAKSIRDFFIARGGRFEAFTWLNPLDNVVYTVRFTDDKLPREAFTPAFLSKFGMKFLEIF